MPKGVYKRKLKIPQERFWKYVKKTNNCWEWIGCLQNKGYGVFSIRGKKIQAHRFSYGVHKKIKIPKELCICHKCDNPSCVNPQHLWIGTRKDNMMDMKIKKRDIKALGEKNGKSKLTQILVLKIKKMYSTGRYSHRKLGDMFLVSHSCVGEILRGKTWNY